MAGLFRSLDIGYEQVVGERLAPFGGSFGDVVNYMRYSVPEHALVIIGRRRVRQRPDDQFANLFHHLVEVAKS